jgi:hypothetical protein
MKDIRGKRRKEKECEKYIMQGKREKKQGTEGNEG